jgi:hypothetical protein
MKYRIRGIFSGLVLLAAFISTATSATAQTTFTSTGPITFTNGVAAANPYPSLLFVGTNGTVSLPGTLQSVTVTLNNLYATVPKDVSVMVEAPNGAAFEIMSGVGGTGTFFSDTFLSISDSAGSTMPMSAFDSGSYKPTVYSCHDFFPSPAPTVYPAAGVCGTSTFWSTFSGLNPNGTWQLFVANQSLGASGSINSWQLNITTIPPTISVTCSHTGNFYEGETGAQYSVVVSNAGLGPTGGSVPAMVVDTLPAGLTPTAANGPGWNCAISNQTVTCIQTNQTAAGTSAPTLTLTVNVGPVTLTSLTNTVTLTGSSDGTHTATDNTTIDPPNPPNPSPNTLIDVQFNTNSLAAGGGFIFGPTMSGAAVLGETGDQWNGIHVSSGTGIPLIYASGISSPVRMAFTSGGGYNVFSFDGTTPFVGRHYEALMEGYLFNGGVPQTITLSGLAANSSYNLVLYNAADTAVSGRTTYFTVNNNTLNSTWDAASSTLIAGTDYVEFALPCRIVRGSW